MKRVLAALLGALNSINGVMMLLDPADWYRRVAVSTGPFNAHFVNDVGAAFLAAGLALIVRAWRNTYWPAAIGGSTFLIFHALIHVADFARHGHDPVGLIFIVVSALAAMWTALPTRSEHRV